MKAKKLTKEEIMLGSRGNTEYEILFMYKGQPKCMTIKQITQALEELEAIKSVDDSVVLVGLVKLLHNYLFRADDLIIINNIKNYILKAQAQEQELRELNVIVNKIKDILALNYSYQEIGIKIERLFKGELK